MSDSIASAGQSAFEATEDGDYGDEYQYTLRQRVGNAPEYLGLSCDVPLLFRLSRVKGAKQT
jgi:hypothetical protein